MRSRELAKMAQNEVLVATISSPIGHQPMKNSILGRSDFIVKVDRPTAGSAHVQ